MGFCNFLILLSCTVWTANAQFFNPLDLESCTSYQEDLGACFQGTEFSSTSPSLAESQIKGFFIQSTEAICGKSALYIQLLKCVYDATARCAPDDQMKSLLVSGSSYETAVKTFCESEQGINITCFMDSQSTYGLCIETKAQSKNLNEQSVNATFSERKNFICSYSEVSIGCLGENEVLETCLDTRTLLLQLWNIFQPDICAADDAFSNRSTLVIIFLTSVISLVNFNS